MRLSLFLVIFVNLLFVTCEAAPAILGHSMAQMYGAMDIDADINRLEKASYLRAAVAQYRDLVQHDWVGMSAKDWNIVEQILLNSYQVLYQIE